MHGGLEHEITENTSISRHVEPRMPQLDDPGSIEFPVCGPETKRDPSYIARHNILRKFSTEQCVLKTRTWLVGKGCDGNRLLSDASEVKTKTDSGDVKINSQTRADFVFTFVTALCVSPVPSCLFHICNRPFEVWNLGGVSIMFHC